MQGPHEPIPVRFLEEAANHVSDEPLPAVDQSGRGLVAEERRKGTADAYAHLEGERFAGDVEPVGVWVFEIVPEGEGDDVTHRAIREAADLEEGCPGLVIHTELDQGADASRNDPGKLVCVTTGKVFWQLRQRNLAPTFETSGPSAPADASLARSTATFS